MFVGLGGNTAGTLAAFSRARRALAVLLTRSVASSLYRTRPQDDPNQDDFWNAVVGGEWEGSAASLLERLLMLEAGLGRVRDALRPKGPRILDLDLLVFGETVLEDERLTVPHGAMVRRRFVLEPLVELAPEIRDPRSGRRWTEWLSLLPPQGVDRTSSPW